MPQRRQNSMVRALTALIFGTLIVPSRFSISTQSTPRSPSSQASARPTGPAPAIRTEVSDLISMSAILRLRLGLVRPELAHDRIDERHVDDVLGRDLGVLHESLLAVEREIDAHAVEIDPAVGVDRCGRDLAQQLGVLDAGVLRQGRDALM